MKRINEPECWDPGVLPEISIRVNAVLGHQADCSLGQGPPEAEMGHEFRHSVVRDDEGAVVAWVRRGTAGPALIAPDPPHPSRLEILCNNTQHVWQIPVAGRVFGID